MSSYRELNEKEINHSYQPSDFKFYSTDDLKETNDYLGQEEKLEELKKSLKIKEPGYHLYLCTKGDLRTEQLITATIQKVALTNKSANALGYLYDFHHPNEPVLVELPMLKAMELKNDLEELRAIILKDLPMKLEEDTVKKEQERLMADFEALKDEYLVKLTEKAKEKKIGMKLTEEGIKFLPLTKEKEPMSLKEYEALSEKDKDKLEHDMEQLQALADEISQALQKEEVYYEELQQEVKEETVLRELTCVIKSLKHKYEKNLVIQNYLNHMAEDFLNHLALLSLSETERKASKKELFSWMNDNDIEKLAARYDLNLLTEPVKKGSPVINDLERPQMTLTGRVLSEAENCSLMQIRPGLMQAAHQGYLILHMQQLLEKPGDWQSLKNILRTGWVRLGDSSHMTLNMQGHILPEPVRADVKVILIGPLEVYEALRNYDSEFKRYFRCKIDVDQEIPYQPENVEKLGRVIKKLSKQEKLPEVTTDGLLRMITYSSRKLGDVKKFHGNIDFFMSLIKEGRWHNPQKIDAVCIEKVIAEREKNDRRIEKQIQDTIMESTYLIDTQGERVGQINGLAVYEIGEIHCARPVKITATTYKGKMGVVAIDGLANLSGAIHTKGVQIMTGFLGGEFAQDFPLTLNCSICFEQNYGLIDGDSASTAELYVTLSSLADIPIKQYLAVTGSMNQFGEVQPIGGVNEKIEGFYKICELRGLKGNEGVIIPQQNTKDLMLDEKVIKSIQCGKFHLYEIQTIWDGMALLTGVEPALIKKRVYEKLKKYSQ